MLIALLGRSIAFVIGDNFTRRGVLVRMYSE
jgi:hypothetical protein